MNLHFYQIVKLIIKHLSLWILCPLVSRWIISSSGFLMEVTLTSQGLHGVSTTEESLWNKGFFLFPEELATTDSIWNCGCCHSKNILEEHETFSKYWEFLWSTTAVTMSRQLKVIEDMGLLILTHEVDCNHWLITGTPLQKYWNNDANSFAFAISLNNDRFVLWMFWVGVFS